MEQVTTVIIAFLFISTYVYTDDGGRLDGDAVERCFCKLKGEVDDCECKIEELQKINNLYIYPILETLSTKPYFRFFHVNLNKKCPFWGSDGECALKSCSVKGCSEDEVPPELKKEEIQVSHEKAKYLKPTEKTEGCRDDNHGGLGTLDGYLSDENKAAFQNWTTYDDQEHSFCEQDDEDGEGMQYVDLKKNPERFTGYGGHSAHRVWNSIYEENCFNDKKATPFSQGKAAAIFIKQVIGTQCLEKRVFYRLISGLHTSINVHLCWMYLLKDERSIGGLMAKGGQVWGPNVDEFQRRFDPNFEVAGPQRLRNLFFTLLVELRALMKVSKYLRKSTFFTGSSDDDIDTQNAINVLLKEVEKFPYPFDESKLFQSVEAKPLYKEFRSHFRNISRIMDCVGCDKCRLWGKLQITGLGTALRILFAPQHIIDSGPPNFQLRRREITALLNAIARLSFSAKHIDDFRLLLKGRS